MLMVGVSMSVAAQETTKVDMNSASSFKLMKINYMSRGLARAIVNYRDKNGEFKTPEDLLKVSGMTAEKMTKMNIQLDSNNSIVAVFIEQISDAMALPNY